MKIVRRSALAAAAAAGLVFAMGGTATAVPEHQHCMLTPEGWVPLAVGVSEEAPHEPTLHNFHEYVHTGIPGTEQLTIVGIPVGGDCSVLPIPV